MRLILGLLAVILIASSSVARAQKVTVDYDKTVNFSNYNTYAWSEGAARNPIVKQMILDAIDSELTAKGLRKVDGNPDLQITFLAATDYSLQVSAGY
jgi:hypothetical protein